MRRPDYQLVRKLESGDLAELYRAGASDGRTVAIKLFHARASDRAYARELAQTARLLSRRQVPGLVSVLEIGMVRDRLAVVREHLPGFTLGDALRRLATKEVLMPPSLALHLILELLELTELVHGLGVAHGALTPGNVLLDQGSGRAAICDFGALRALHAAPALAKVFSARGRSAYRAPEVLQGEPAGHVADVFSLGAIAYELLTLQEPLGPKAQNVSVRREAPLPPSRLDRRINPRLDPIILRALDPSPSRRFQRCLDFARALREQLSTVGGIGSGADLTRFIAELFPNEVKLEAPGPVPFDERFALEPIDGAAIVAPSAGSSGPDDEANTSEAVPPFEPLAGEGTAPGQAGPLERGWHAPPGAGVAALSDLPTRQALRRVRVIQESVPWVEPSLPPFPPPVPTPGQAAAPPASLPNTTDVQVPRMDTQADAPSVPPPTQEARSTGPGLRHRALLMATLFLGAMVTSAWGLWLWRRGHPPPPPARSLPPPDESVARVDGAVQKFINQAPAPPVADRSQPDEPIHWHVPPSGKNAGFLTISSDVPAIVYIDKQRVRRTTPLKGYPVSPGPRRIALVEVSTGERHELTLTFRRGQTRKLEELFGPRKSRRR